jgi:hypothetical protein
MLNVTMKLDTMIAHAILVSLVMVPQVIHALISMSVYLIVPTTAEVILGAPTCLATTVACATQDFLVTHSRHVLDALPKALENQSYSTGTTTWPFYLLILLARLS